MENKRMKLTTITQITLDGVTQGNGGSTEEDLRDGFDRGGWARGAGDDTTRDHIAATFQRADAFLFGRRTHDILRDFWGTMADLKQHPVGVALNSKPKYVASTTLTRSDWANTEILGDDLFRAVTDLKDSRDGELQVHGSSRLIQWLLEKDLVDEMEFITVPVVLGQGARLFADSGRDIALNLVDVRTDSKGVMIHSYRPVGRPAYATF